MWTPEIAELLGAIGAVIVAKTIDWLYERSVSVPTPRSPRYDQEAHAARLRKLLARRIATLPLKALVKLQEVAALLEAGERLDVFLARERVGKKRGKIQVQRREDVDRGQRTTAATSLEYALLEDDARADIEVAVRARRAQWRRPL